MNTLVQYVKIPPFSVVSGDFSAFRQQICSVIEKMSLDKIIEWLRTDLDFLYLVLWLTPSEVPYQLNKKRRILSVTNSPTADVRKYWATQPPNALNQCILTQLGTFIDTAARVVFDGYRDRYLSEQKSFTAITKYCIPIFLSQHKTTYYVKKAKSGKYSIVTIQNKIAIESLINPKNRASTTFIPYELVDAMDILNVHLPVELCKLCVSYIKLDWRWDWIYNRPKSY